MKEDLFVLSGSRVERVGSRTVKPYERDPSKIWLGSSQWYLNLSDFTLTHEGEQIGTMYAVDPSVLLHTTLVYLGERTSGGCLVKSPTATWFEISNQLQVDPSFRFEFCALPAKFEHFLAGAYHVEGWESVVVTPQSGDKGRDVIAEQNAERVLQEAKAYRVRIVKAEQVRALYGVLSHDSDATRAVITTTADFAPGIAEEFRQVMPNVLETVDGDQFLKNVERITTTQSAASIGAKLFESAGVLAKPNLTGRFAPQRQLVTLQQLGNSIG
jgi:restriction system protein